MTISRVSSPTPLTHTSHLSSKVPNLNNASKKGYFAQLPNDTKNSSTRLWLNSIPLNHISFVVSSLMNANILACSMAHWFSINYDATGCLKEFVLLGLDFRIDCLLQNSDNDMNCLHLVYQAVLSKAASQHKWSFRALTLIERCIKWVVQKFSFVLDWYFTHRIH